MIKKRIGILGGGQLGKMLAIAAANWHLDIWILDKSADFPAAPYCTKFVAGDFDDYDDVLNFGRQVDVVTVEIEHVNIKALFELQKEGKIIHPAPEKLEIIKDKALQKLFYLKNEIPASDFQLFDDEVAIKDAVQNGELQLPFVQKSRTAGYDGRGVSVINTSEDLLKNLLPGASVVEKLVDIEKELAVIVCRNEMGEMSVFPPVEMVFNPVANLVEFLVCPAGIDLKTTEIVNNLGLKTAEAFQICGLLAIEMFLAKSGEVLINEVAPRPHNSGHHTIESCCVSQFEQHLRGILNLPLGETDLKLPAVMLNLLGEPGYAGKPVFSGLEDALKISGLSVHFYGKKETKPFRKMGHITIVDKHKDEAIKKAKQVQTTLKIIANE